MRTIRVSLGVIAGLALAASVSEAQQPPRRPPSRTIEIRGQVPTPQVVTVRPREAPQFDRNVLVPDFYNPDFLGLATVGYQLVPRSTITGGQRDTVLMAERKVTPPAVGVITTPEQTPRPKRLAGPRSRRSERSSLSAGRDSTPLQVASSEWASRRPHAIPHAGRSDI
jgi:hypothetical protein